MIRKATTTLSLSTKEALPVVFFVCSLLLTYFVWFIYGQAFLKREERCFDERVVQIIDVINNRISQYQLILQGAEAMFLVSEEITGDQWQAYYNSRQISLRYPGINKFVYCEYPDTAERELYIDGDSIRLDNISDEYLPIVFIEPFDCELNKNMIGYNLYSEPVYREALTHARDTGETVISGMIELVTGLDNNIQPSFIVIVPVYKKEMPLNSFVERRVAIEGYIVGFVSAVDFFHNLFLQSNYLVDFQIYAGSEIAAELELYNSFNLTNTENAIYEPLFTSQVVLEHYHQWWSLIFQTTPAYESNIKKNTGRVILVIGIMFSFIFYIYIRSLLLTAKRARALSLEMAVNSKESEEKLLQISENIDEVFWLRTENPVKTLYVNRAYEKIWGKSCQSLYQYPDSFMDNVYIEDREIVNKEFLKYNETGLFSLEYRIVREDGDVRWVRVRTYPVRDSGGDCTSYAGIAADITERKKAEVVGRQLIFEKTLSDILSSFIGCSWATFEDVMSDVLKRVAQQYGFGSSYLYLLSHNKKEMENTYGWYSEEHSSQFNQRQTIRADDYPWLMEKLNKFETVLLADMINVSAKAIKDIRNFFGYIPNSIMFFPIVNDGKLFGILIFNLSNQFVIRRKEEIEQLKVIAETISGLLLKHHADLELQKRAEFQKLLMQIATSFVNPPLGQINETINEMLKMVGDYTGVDRAYIFTHNHEKKVTYNTYEWCAKGITSEINNLQEIPFSSFTEIIEAHDTTEIFNITDVATLPAASKVRSILEAQDIKSLILIPLVYEKTNIGFVGFDAVMEHRIFSDLEKPLLSLLAELITNILMRHLKDAELLEMNQQLQITQKKSESANRAKSRFLASMSHEIRSPMNIICGMTNLLCESGLQSEQLDYAKMARDSAEHLLTIINDILDFSRIEAGQFEIIYSQFELAKEVGKTVTPFVKRAQDLGLELLCHFDDQLPDLVVGDLSRLNQVLINLVDNAIKFTNAGKIELMVWPEEIESIGSVKADKLQNICFAVSDTGPGIEAGKEVILFEHFSQLSGPDEKSAEGTGLGLAISKNLTELMGGHIWYESEPGEGSTFYFSLPFKLPADQDENKTIVKEEIISLDKKNKSLTLLLAEDKPMNQKLVKVILEKIGHRVDVVSNGIEALSAVKAKQYDAVFMDINMPQMDGLEATKRIRLWQKHTWQKPLPIIAMTAYAMKGDREKYLKEGMDSYISKPFKKEEILKVIEQIEFAIMKPSDDLKRLKQENESVCREKYDLGIMLERVDGNVCLLNELVKEFFTDFNKELVEMETALDQKRYDHAAKIIHGFKGELGNLGFESEYKLAIRLESLLTNKEFEHFQELFIHFKNRLIEYEKYFLSETWLHKLE